MQKCFHNELLFQTTLLTMSFLSSRWLCVTVVFVTHFSFCAACQLLCMSLTKSANVSHTKTSEYKGERTANKAVRILKRFHCIVENEGYVRLLKYTHCT